MEGRRPRRPTLRPARPRALQKPPSGALRRQQGVVLVIVLWLLAVIAVLAAGFSRTTRTETLFAANQVQAARARGVAEAGVWLGVQDLLRPDSARQIPVYGVPRSTTFADGTVEIRVQDESGKIDLNSGREELIRKLVEVNAGDSEAVAAIADAILDWRDRDNLRRTFGAEDDEYQAAGYAWGAKDGPFNSVEELRMVLGMNEALFRRIEPALTVFSHQSGINARTAVPAALTAVTGLDEEAARQILEQRGDAEAPAGLPLADTGFRSPVRSGGRTFTVTSTGRVADVTVHLEAVVVLRLAGSQPYTVLSWREGK